MANNGSSNSTSIKFGDPLEVRFAGRKAEFRPMLMSNGSPQRYPVDLSDRSILNAVVGEVSYPGGAPRAVVMGMRPQRKRISKDAFLEEKARQDGHPNRRFLQLYKRPASRDIGGNEVPPGIFELPVTDGPEESDIAKVRHFDGQTVGYLVTDEATGERVDLYIRKGWSYATCADVVETWQRAEANGKRAAEEKRLASPVAVLEKVAGMMLTRGEPAKEPPQKGQGARE